MSELASQQINAKCDTIIAFLREAREATHDEYVARANENVCALNAEITMLRRLIYRNAEFLRFVDNHFLQGVIAEFEPNTPDGG